MRSRRIVLATGDRADAADAVGALTGVDEVLAGLTPEEKLDVVRGEQGRAAVIMIGDGINDAPALALGADPTTPMSRAHAEIAYQIARLGRLIDDIGTRPPDEADIADLRGVLYGLHAILRLHTVQEDETYLSLGDSADAVPR